MGRYSCRQATFLRSPGEMSSPALAMSRQLLADILFLFRYLSPGEARREGL
ncbi:hypothetical protein A2U01_0073616, partial [Trifolium medium]|nr:hypothetical protein [Trifolium medium]